MTYPVSHVVHVLSAMQPPSPPQPTQPAEAQYQPGAAVGDAVAVGVVVRDHDRDTVVDIVGEFAITPPQPDGHSVHPPAASAAQQPWYAIESTFGD